MGKPDGDRGSEERQKWFEEWAATHPNSPPSSAGLAGLPNAGGIPISFLQQLLAAQGGQQDTSTTGKKKVRTPGYDVMKQAIDKHEALNWDDRMSSLVESECFVLRVDDSDGTTQVRFEANSNHDAMSAWLPSEILEDVA